MLCVFSVDLFGKRFEHPSYIGLGDTSLFKRSPWGHNWPRPKGTYIYVGLYSKNLVIQLS